MSVWFAIPSARPPEEVEPVLKQWRERGYKIALFCDSIEDLKAKSSQHEGLYPSIASQYPGYAKAVNMLAVRVFDHDPDCDWIVTGGDDTLPDPDHSAEEIAGQCTEHFGGPLAIYGHKRPQNTFGVMQPTGDRFAQGSIDRIAGSPWMGREWCLRANGGKGPLWPEFTHMFADEALKGAAEMQGVYWMRPDLIHLHRHYTRESDVLDANSVPKPVPEHFKKWNTVEHWNESKAIFERLKANGFRECLPK